MLEELQRRGSLRLDKLCEWDTLRCMDPVRKSRGWGGGKSSKSSSSSSILKSVRSGRHNPECTEKLELRRAPVAEVVAYS